MGNVLFQQALFIKAMNSFIQYLTKINFLMIVWYLCIKDSRGTAVMKTKSRESNVDVRGKMILPPRCKKVLDVCIPIQGRLERICILCFIKFRELPCQILMEQQARRK